MASAEVSVVLPAWNSHETVAACLESLASQTYREFETLVVDSSPGRETEEIVRTRFLDVRYHHSPHRLLPHAARNLGAGLARGAILVFSDPDCRMPPEWLDVLVRAQRQGHEAAGGAVANLGGGWFEQGVHLAKYGWWLPGGRPGPRADLPSANVSYSRDLFRRIGPFPEAWSGDTLLSSRARAAGVVLWFDPAAVVFHDHRTGWTTFLGERYARGRDYGLVRPVVERWSRLRTLLYALAAPAVGPWMAARAVRYAAEAGQLAGFISHLPIVVAGLTARAAGEGAAHWSLAWRRF
jgi:GT2 family glycosyltransferase